MPVTSPRIIVKLNTDQVAIPYKDAAQTTLTGQALFFWQGLSAAFPAIQLNRLLSTQSSAQLLNLMQTAEIRSGIVAPNLLSFMAVDFPEFIDHQLLLNAVRTLPFIEFAYIELPTEQAAVDPSNDLFASFQNYMGPAPYGIEAYFAWSLAGGDGSNVRFVDIEYGWDLTHEDLSGAGIIQLNQSVPGYEFHSTACLGIVLGQDNDRGIVGIAHRAKGAIASAISPSLGDAFVAAVSFLEAGDVLLIEVQAPFGQPVEINPHIALLIHTLRLLGIIVIEPAGNGGVNLDLIFRPDGTSLQRGSSNFFDSGAIMVGARQAFQRARITSPFASSFGTRVDCHAWGENIVTTSPIPGQPYMGIIPGGTPGFSGTSGASAIIAGAAASLQGIAKARGSFLMPDRMRSVLSDPAFNTTTDNIDLIGVMPNLREAVNHI